MPLPAIGFAPSLKQDHHKFDDSDEYSSDDDVEGILTMLRSTPSENPRASEKASTSFVTPKSGGNTTNSLATPKSSNANNDSDSKRRVKFDPAFDKPSRDLNSSGSKNFVANSSNASTAKSFGSPAEPPRHGEVRQAPMMKPSVPQRTNEREVSTKTELISRKIDSNKSHSDGKNNTLELHPPKTTKARAELRVAGALSQQSAAPINIEPGQSQTQIGITTSDSYNDMMHRIHSSQLSIQEICEGIKALQTTQSSDNPPVKSIEKLIEGVTENHNQLQVLTSSLKQMSEGMALSNAEEKENLIELQLCAETERKVMMEQLSNEKTNLADRWKSYEKDVEFLRAQRNELEMEKDAILVEKEQLQKDQMQFQKIKALFEQRKIAASDQLDYAEARIATAQQMGAKLQSEMDKLMELSDFVTRKDAEANEKLAKADEMYGRAKELERSLMADAEIIEQQKEQLSQDRFLLAQERVAALKEKTFNRDMHMKGTTSLSISERQFPTEFGTPDLALRKRLASIKHQLDKLRDE